MANSNYNKYVGARYVPLFMGEWDKQKTYEPLMIVSYQGNSYTSKTFIPKNIEINNPIYWALTGNYNAQVESYRIEVQQLSGEIETTQNDFNNLISTTIDKQPIIVNDVANINQFIALAITQNRDIFIPKKSEPYIINAPILPLSNIRIYSNGATIKPSNSFNMVEITNQMNVIIEGLVLDGNKSTNNSNYFNGILITNSQNIIIKNNIIKNIKGYDTNDGAIKLIGTTNKCNIEKNNISLCDGGGIVLTGIEVKNNLISYNTIENILKSPIMIKTQSNNNLISNNTISKGGETNISINGDFNIVENNIINESSLLGINLGHEGNDNKEKADYCIVRNNVLNNVGIGGVNCSYSIIENNTINNPNGLKAIGLADCNSIVINNNIINGGGTSGSITVTPSTFTVMSGCQINGNKLSEIGREGIRFSCLNNSIISKNILINCCAMGQPSYDAYDGAIIIEGTSSNPSQYNNIESNTIIDTQTRKVKRGISATSSINSNNLINNNIINGLEIPINASTSKGNNFINGVITPIA